MVLWTIQSEKAWGSFQKKGFLRADGRLIAFRKEKLWSPYLWMSNQMKEKLGRPPRGVIYPLWAWYQYRGENKRKPDLRNRGFLHKNEKGFLIEFEANNKEILLSDFEGWHYVLNYWFLPNSKTEESHIESELIEKGLSFYRQKPLPGFHRRIKKSWERIFDFGKMKYVSGQPKKFRSIQATMWELRKEQIRKYTPFVER